MPKQKTDDLLQLVNSLTKGEKRNFRLFAGRNTSAEDAHFFRQLFDVLDKRGEYDEAFILKKIPAIKKSQLPNIKAHLYRQLLASLRLLGKNQQEDFQLRELIDYAQLLYNKGLYRQSLDMLAKVKDRALQGQFYAQALEVVEFEKLIESQYITRSIEGRAEELTGQTHFLNQMLTQTNQFSNLSLQMYALFLKTGFAHNQKDYQQVQEFFTAHLPSIDFQDLDFWGKIYYCQAHLWRHHISQEFSSCYRHAQRWVDLFRNRPAMIGLNPVLYLKGLHNLLFTLFNSAHYARFMEGLDLLQRFPEEYDLGQSRNVEGLYRLYWYLQAINRHYMEGTFTEGLQLVPELMELIAEERFNWDNHRIIVFYYRIACLYFGSGDFGQTIHFLNLIINQKNPDYRADIQCFARILCLIAHFELGNDRLVEYQIKSVYRFLLQMEDMHAVQKAVFGFLRRTPGMRPAALRDEFGQLREKLLLLRDDPFERRPFLYLDIISWLECKLENRTVQAVVRDQFLVRQQRKRSGLKNTALFSDDPQ